MAGDSHRHAPQQLQIADVGHRVAESGQLPVEYRADLIADEGEVAGLGVAVHQRHRGMRRGPTGLQLVQQSLQRGQGPALDPLQLLRPVVDFPVQVIAAVIQGIQVHLGDVHRVDRGKLLSHALAHPPDTVGAHVGFLRRLHLVDGPRHSFHHEEGSAEDVARILQPQCTRYAHSRAFQRPQYGELPCQIIGFEQCRRPRAQPHHDVAARLVAALHPRRSSTPSSRPSDRTPRDRDPRPAGRRHRASACAAIR